MENQERSDHPEACPERGGDCSAANPPVIGCPMREQSASRQVSVRTRARIWVCTGVQIEKRGMTTNVNPRSRLTLAFNEDEAVGGFTRWASAEWPRQALHSVGAFAVPDDFVAAAAAQMEEGK